MLPLAKLTIMRLDWSVKSAVLMQSLAGMKIPFKPSENKIFFLWPLARFSVLLFQPELGLM